jgi:phage terminase small subunit
VAVATKRKVTKADKAGTSKQAAGEKKKLFAEAYIANGGNASEAAKSAGYSAKTAGVTGCRLLKDVQVQSILGERQKALANKYELTAEAIIKSIAQELHFDPANLFNEDGSVKSVSEMDADTRMALVSIETLQLGDPESPAIIRKIKWATKHQAREQAMKHLGMFEQDNKQKSDPITALTEFLMERTGGTSRLPIADD